MGNTITQAERNRLVALAKQAIVLDATGEIVDGFEPAWRSFQAQQIGASLPTLDALVKRGILENYEDALGGVYSPRTANYYRLAKPATGKE